MLVPIRRDVDQQKMFISIGLECQQKLLISRQPNAERVEHYSK